MSAKQTLVKEEQFQTKQLLATKLAPTIILGSDMLISTRNIKLIGGMPFQVEDCDGTFKEFRTNDTTDVLLNSDNTDEICDDILEEHFLEIPVEELVDYDSVILTKKDQKINAKRVSILTTNLKLLKTEKLVKKSGRHKATEYYPKKFTLCSILKEEENIFQGAYFENFKVAKMEQIPKNGQLEILVKK